MSYRIESRNGSELSGVHPISQVAAERIRGVVGRRRFLSWSVLTLLAFGGVFASSYLPSRLQNLDGNESAGVSYGVKVNLACLRGPDGQIGPKVIVEDYTPQRLAARVEIYHPRNTPGIIPGQELKWSALITPTASGKYHFANYPSPKQGDIIVVYSSGGQAIVRFKATQPHCLS